MKKKLTKLFNAVADGIFPNIQNSRIIENGETIGWDRARLTISILSWALLLGIVSGKVPVESIFEWLKIYLNEG